MHVMLQLMLLWYKKASNHESSHMTLEVKYGHNSEENKYLNFSKFKKKDKNSLAFFPCSFVHELKFSFVPVPGIRIDHYRSVAAVVFSFLFCEEKNLGTTGLTTDSF